MDLVCVVETRSESLMQKEVRSKQNPRNDREGSEKCGKGGREKVKKSSKG